ncbi:MAG: hypothetical protein NT013_13790 [Planctomycetia bacterium]|nr:hypothetical protein [Planctomycetia bacterium]
MNRPTNRDTDDGARPKQQALPFSESCREKLVLKARRGLLIHALEFATVTADDVRELVPLPPGINPTIFGSVPGPLANAGIILFHGYVKTTRKMAHARRNVNWFLNDRDAAKRWLITHPDPDDTSPTTAGSEG